jgi:hypothetical protein
LRRGSPVSWNIAGRIFETQVKTIDLSIREPSEVNITDADCVNPLQHSCTETVVCGPRQSWELTP